MPDVQKTRKPKRPNIGRAKICTSVCERDGERERERYREREGERDIE